MSDDVKQKKDEIDRLVARAKRDSGFKQRVKEDPVGALQEAGFTEDALREVLIDEGYGDLDPEDKKLKPKQKKAVDVARDCWSTCWLSDCPCTRCCITV